MVIIYNFIVAVVFIISLLLLCIFKVCFSLLFVVPFVGVCVIRGVYVYFFCFSF